uniref:ParB-like N-terminal domain-containing protein n=1 Tax=viral metagenome TaxID=1070528 RepID=A0A6M3MAW4_9ZZZZ
MKLRTVDPKQIKVPEVRVTAQFDEELYQQFKDSIKEVGQITPPICYEVGEELILCDGLHRTQEAIANGEATIKVVVIPGDMIDVLTKNIFLDHLRGKTPVSQMVKVITTLFQEYNLDSDQIREKTGLTRAYIEKLIRIGEASPVVQDALDRGILGIGHAFELSRLPYAVQQEEIIAKHQVWRFSVTELHDQIDAVLREMKLIAEEGPPTAVTEPRPIAKYHCEGCKDEIEPRYLRPVMLCPNCFGEVWRLGKARETAEVESAEEPPSP